MKRWMFLGLVAMTALLWLACTGGEATPTGDVSAPHDEETAPEDGEAVHEDGEDADQGGGHGGGSLHVILDEWSLTDGEGRTALTADAGELVLEVHNDGVAPHELVVLRTDLAPDALPLAGDVVDQAAAGEVVGTIEEFPGGQIQIGSVHLTPGKYVLACTLPGHYQQGMHAQITVE